MCPTKYFVLPTFQQAPTPLVATAIMLVNKDYQYYVGGLNNIRLTFYWSLVFTS